MSDNTDAEARADAAQAAAPTRPGAGERRSGRVTFGPRARDLRAARTRTQDEELLQRKERPAFLDSDPWRTLRILSEFVEGFEALAGLGPAVAVFGSACARARKSRSCAGKSSSRFTVVGHGMCRRRKRRGTHHERANRQPGNRGS